MCLSEYIYIYNPFKRCVMCKQAYFNTRESSICKDCFEIINKRLFPTEFNEYR